jgi:hypothetical protein
VSSPVAAMRVKFFSSASIRAIARARQADAFTDEVNHAGFHQPERPVVAMQKTYTDKEGRYRAFIHYDSEIHRCSPSEGEMRLYLRISPQQ